MDEVQVFFFQFEATVGCRETNSAWHKLLPVGSFNEDSFAKLSNVQPEEPAGLGSYFLDSKSYVPDRLPKPPLDKNDSEKVKERFLDKLKEKRRIEACSVSSLNNGYCPFKGGGD